MTDFLSAVAPDDEVGHRLHWAFQPRSERTTDRSVLMSKTIGHVRAALGFGLDALGRSNTSNVIAPDAKIMKPCTRARLTSSWRTSPTSLAGSSHSRRAIVDVTDGSIISTVPVTGLMTRFQPETTTDSEYLQDAYDAARRADVPIYTIDRAVSRCRRTRFEAASSSIW